MASKAPRKSPPRDEYVEHKAKTARADDPVDLSASAVSRFSSYADLLWFHNKAWDDVLPTDEYKLYVLVRFLMAARIAGSSFNESGVKWFKRLSCFFFLYCRAHRLLCDNVTRPFSRPSSPGRPSCATSP